MKIAIRTEPPPEPVAVETVVAIEALTEQIEAIGVRLLNANYPEQADIEPLAEEMETVRVRLLHANQAARLAAQADIDQLRADRQRLNAEAATATQRMDFAEATKLSNASNAAGAAADNLQRDLRGFDAAEAEWKAARPAPAASPAASPSTTRAK
jgi:hypothetical protein